MTDNIVLIVGGSDDEESNIAHLADRIVHEHSVTSTFEYGIDTLTTPDAELNKAWADAYNVHMHYMGVIDDACAPPFIAALTGYAAVYDMLSDDMIADYDIDILPETDRAAAQTMKDAMTVILTKLDAELLRAQLNDEADFQGRIMNDRYKKRSTKVLRGFHH